MENIVAIAVVLIIIKIAVDVASNSKKGKSSKQYSSKSSSHVPEYKSQKIILTPTEQVFYKHLKEAVPYLGISLKVRLADVIKPVGQGSEYMSAFGKIKSKHLDFVLYDPTTFQIVGAIELDDQSHSRKNREDRDEFVNKAMQKTSIPLIRLPAKITYDMEILKTTVLSMILYNNNI
ncbi:MAG: DUF2726 domain-containing protein [Pontiellaceae bacterium]|nr:DUF2726 domain-containing protein [Pontiellaceae bacterium]